MEIIKYAVSIAVLFFLTTSALAADTEQTGDKHQQMVEKFAYILNEQWGVDADAISGEVFFLNDFGADDLDIIELVMALEEYFDVLISDDDWSKITTVDSAVELISDIKNRRGW